MRQKNFRIATCFAASCYNTEDCGTYIWDVEQKDIMLYDDPVLEQSAKSSMVGLVNQKTTIAPLSSAVVVSVDGDELSWEKAQKSAYIFTPRTYTKSTTCSQLVYVHGKCVDMMPPHAFIRIPGTAKAAIRASLGLTDSSIYPGEISRCLTALEGKYTGAMQKVEHTLFGKGLRE